MQYGRSPEQCFGQPDSYAGEGLCKINPYLHNTSHRRLLPTQKLMEKAGVDEECLSKIRNSVSSDPLNWPKTLRIVEGIIFSMPYVDHGMLSRLLLETWECVDGIFRHSRQTYFRKVIYLSHHHHLSIVLCQSMLLMCEYFNRSVL